MRRWLVISLGLLGVGCHFRTVASPCGPGGACPEGTTCDPRVNRCLVGYRSPDGSQADGGPDVAGDGLLVDAPAGDGPVVDAPVGDAAAVDGEPADGPAPDLGPTYTWQDGKWTPDCSPCWGGTQTGDVWCERDDGTQVEDGFCDAGSKTDSTRNCAAPTEVCYWWRAKDRCVHLYGKCGDTDPDEWFQDWDCCSTAALDCDLPNEDCINADVDHCGTCHPDSSCDGWPGQDCNYPE